MRLVMVLGLAACGEGAPEPSPTLATRPVHDPGVASSSRSVTEGDSFVASNTSAGDAFGLDLDVGDVNGDGLGDIVVGAVHGDSTAAGGGAAYVFLGSPSSATSWTERALMPSSGGADDRFGCAVASAGDIDADGYDDVLVGHCYLDGSDTLTGGAWVFYGSATGTETTGTLIEPSDATYRDFLGSEVSGVGDIDGDGYADIAITSYLDDAGATNAGSVYVYLGSSSGVDASTEQELSASDATAAMLYGSAISGPGDVNGDGYGDLVVGAQDGEGKALTTGTAYALLGSATGIDASSEAKVSASNGDRSDDYGETLDLVGDLDGDGYDDLVVGANNYDDPSYSFIPSRGTAYVFYGSASGIDTSTEHQLFPSDTTYHAFGSAVAGLGDLDGDGFDDFIVGAIYDSDVASHGGAAYVYFGSSTGANNTEELKLSRSGTDAKDYLGYAVGGGGDLDGDGIGDAVTGSFNASDLVSGGGGLVTVWTGSCTDDDGDGVCEAQDCDDTDASVHPGAAEVTGDGVDQDCDGTETCYEDADDDGFLVSSPATVASADTDCDDTGEGTDTDPLTDCDDTDAAVNPDATEDVGDGVDSDCDGTEICYDDGDDDGYLASSPATRTSSDTDCQDRYEGSDADPLTDCDDADASVHPGAAEDVGDEVDSDCDGAETCYEDADDDGYLVSSPASVASSDTDCTDTGEGRASDPDGDCDDTDPAIHPGATDVVGDEVDQDCDGGETCYEDADSDGYLAPSPASVASADTDCTDAGEGLATDPMTDCDDTDATVWPGAPEAVGDGVDSDCDGAEVCYLDADDDGYLVGAPATVLSTDTSCLDAGEGSDTDPRTDCDDTDPTVHPGASEEIGDGVDQDCDGLEGCYVDGDDDGYLPEAPDELEVTDLRCEGTGLGGLSTPGGDCDDSDDSVHPGATELPGDEVDQDCDELEVCYVDADGDGYRPDGGATVDSADTSCSGAGEARADTPEGDCDDTSPDVSPGAEELVDDGVDSDCDGWEACYVDADGDGYRPPGEGAVSSEDLDCLDAGEAGADTPGDDCDDTDADAYPGAPEVPGDGVDQDCDGEDAPGEDDEVSCGCDGSAAAVFLLGLPFVWSRRSGRSQFSKKQMPWAR